jgi:N-dimethylarginine dimethylaminohydrolase
MNKSTAHHQVLLCRPNHFRVDYQINPWMQVGSVDPQKALAQWNNLVSQYQKLGLEVEIIEQNEKYPDMVFAADQGLLLGDRSILLSNFKHPERRGEGEFYHNWYLDHGYKVTPLTQDLYLEGGGELQRWRNYLIIGLGFRTDLRSAQKIAKVFDKEVLYLELDKQQFYHLDTCLMALNKDVVFYHREAFSASSVRELQSKVPHLIEIDDTEVANFAANSVVVGSTVVMQEGNSHLARQVEGFGYRVVTVDVREFMKAGGGVHCLTGDLGGLTQSDSASQKQRQ